MNGVLTTSMLHNVMLGKNYLHLCGYLSLHFYVKKRLKIACCEGITSEELRAAESAGGELKLVGMKRANIG